MVGKENQRFSCGQTMQMQMQMQMERGEGRGERGQEKETGVRDGTCEWKWKWKWGSRRTLAELELVCRRRVRRTGADRGM
jgi:hypothetical protein